MDDSIKEYLSQLGKKSWEKRIKKKGEKEIKRLSQISIAYWRNPKRKPRKHERKAKGLA